MSFSLIPPDTHVFYHVEGNRQVLKVTLFLDSYYFSKLPTRFQNGGSLKLHAVLFTKGTREILFILSFIHLYWAPNTVEMKVKLMDVT